MRGLDLIEPGLELILLFSFRGRFAEDAFGLRGLGMQGRFPVPFHDVNFGNTAANVDVTWRANAQPDPLVVNGKDRDFNIVGEFDRFSDLPA
jgi:hypothetical protein